MEENQSEGRGGDRKGEEGGGALVIAAAEQTGG